LSFLLRQKRQSEVFSHGKRRLHESNEKRGMLTSMSTRPASEAGWLASDGGVGDLMAPTAALAGACAFCLGLSVLTGASKNVSAYYRTLFVTFSATAGLGGGPAGHNDARLLAVCS
jgi:hypothetical protein